MGRIGIWKKRKVVLCRKWYKAIYQNRHATSYRYHLLLKILTQFPRRIYPAKSALSSNSCASAMNINLSPSRTVTFSVQPFSILAFQQVSSAAKATSYISGTLSWILRMEKSDQRTCPGCFRTCEWSSPTPSGTPGTSRDFELCSSPMRLCRLRSMV